MNYTSGTTGNPKGIFRKLTGVSPEEAALGLSGILFLFGIQPQDDNVHIVGSPLYHTAVMRFSGASIHLGHTIVVMDKWIPEEMLQLIEKYKVTCSHMVPTQFHRLLALPEETRTKYDMSSLRHMIHAAAPCPVDVKYKMIEWWGNAIDEYYAASEGGGTLVTAAEWLEKPGTVGKAWPISEIAIFDDDDNRVEEPNVIGTVYMSMGTADFEYHKDKKKTESNRIGKYFTVGDVGLIDEDGYLFLRDRKIDMIISGGANIYPAEIENVLLGFPKIGDAAVFGIPHDDWGEEIKAVIEPADGVEPSPSWPPRSSSTAPPGWPSSRPPSRSTSPTPCPGTRTASSTSASCATPTGWAGKRSDPCGATGAGSGLLRLRHGARRGVAARARDLSPAWAANPGRSPGRRRPPLPGPPRPGWRPA